MANERGLIKLKLFKSFYQQTGHRVAAVKPNLGMILHKMRLNLKIVLGFPDKFKGKSGKVTKYKRILVNN